MKQSFLILLQYYLSFVQIQLQKFVVKQLKMLFIWLKHLRRKVNIELLYLSKLKHFHFQRDLIKDNHFVGCVINYFREQILRIYFLIDYLNYVEILFNVYVYHVWLLQINLYKKKVLVRNVSIWSTYWYNLWMMNAGKFKIYCKNMTLWFRKLRRRLYHVDHVIVVVLDWKTYQSSMIKLNRFVNHLLKFDL